MKNVKRFIKGLLLTALFIGVFNLNIQPILQSTVETSGYAEGAISQIETEAGSVALSGATLADYLIPQAFAQEEDVGGNKVHDNSAAAEDAAAKAAAAKKEKDPLDIKQILETVARASTYVNSLFNPLIHFFTFNIGNFLGNDYIFAGKMGEMLHSIWVVSRNIVNIVFVLILLFLAVRHIFGSEEGGNTDLKKTLPAFVIMLIAINFSWLAGRVVLDAANVATNVVFQIPAGVQGVVGDFKTIKCESAGMDKVKGHCMPTAFYYPADTKKSVYLIDDACNQSEIEQGYKDTYETGDKPNPEAHNGNYYQTATICWKQMDIAQYNQNNASYFLSFSMARVQNLTQATTGEDISKVTIGILFSLIIQIVYLLAFLALYIALIMRMAALWIFMAFSPFLVLGYYLSKDLQMQGASMESFSIKAFVNWAFVPAMVGAVWTVGFIMVTTGQTLSSDFFEKLNDKGGVTSHVFSASSLFMGMDNLQQFIWLLITVGIIWIGTFAALKKVPMIDSVTGKINEYGTRMAKVVGSAPKWAPIMPLYNYETGKLDWSRRTSLESISPLRKFESMRDTFRSKMDGGMTSVQKFTKAETELKRAKNKGELGKFGLTFDGGEFDKFKRITGLSNEDIVRDKEGFRKMMKSSDVFEHPDKLAKHAIILAGNDDKKIPGTVTPNIEGQVEKGVRKGEARATTDELQRESTGGQAKTVKMVKGDDPESQAGRERAAGKPGKGENKPSTPATE